MKRWMVPTMLIAVGCAHAPGPSPLSRNLDIEALEVAVRWPEPAVTPVLALVNQLGATHREAEGRDLFCERAQAAPGRPLFTALCGMFEARTSTSVPLLQRVAYVEGALAKLDRAAEKDGLWRFLRGVVETGLPERFGRAARAKEDLEWVLAHADRFPPGVVRGVRAYLQRPDRGVTPMLTTFSVGTREGL